ALGADAGVEPRPALCTDGPPGGTAMDDSERSYGYSDDIYHGQHDREDEKSYEYGPEDPEETQGETLSPEEQAIHIEGSHSDHKRGPPKGGGARPRGPRGLLRVRPQRGVPPHRPLPRGQPGV